MNELQVINDERFQIFSKENLGSVRTVLVNNEVWFCIKDICDILELTNPTVVAKRLDEDEKAKFDLGLKNGELTNFTNESGLYALIVRIDKKEAKPFRKWITSEVIPAIRKTGNYSEKQKQVTEYQIKNQKIRDRYSRAKMSKELLDIAKNTDNPIYKEILNAYAANTLADADILPLPRLEQKTYSAEEIGNILGVSKQKIGRLATKYELKSDENGYLIADKSPYSNKQVESFRYFEHAIEKFKKVLEEERELN